jgi:imidazolonepropionase-like amidohydrolase
MTRTVLTNANLLDGHQPARPGMTIVVEGDRVIDVTAGPALAETGDHVLDLAGRTVMPGMVTAHMHAQFGFLTASTAGQGIPSGSERPPGVMMVAAVATCQKLLQSGFTAYAGAGCGHDIDAQLKMAIEESIIDGPRIRAGSHHVNTTSDTNDWVKWWYDMGNTGFEVFADGPDELRKAVRREIKHGAEIIKIYPTSGHGVVGRAKRNLARDELEAVVAAAHQRGALVRAHCVYLDSLIECLEVGVDIIDHGDEADDRCIQMMLDQGTFWVPGMYYLKSAVARTKDLPVQSAYDPRPEWQQLCETLPKASEAGVKIVPGDDYGSGLMRHEVGVYAKELSVYVNDVGIKPLDVIRWATVNGGELMGRPGEIGTIAAGAFADLVVVEQNPADDITVLEDPVSNIPAVMKGGRFVKQQLRPAASA